MYASGSDADDLPDRHAQRLQREWLGQEGIEQALVDTAGEIAGAVTADKDDWHGCPERADGAGSFLTVELRHREVEDDSIDAVGVLLVELDGGFPIGGGEGLKAEGFKAKGSETEDRRFVVGIEDGVAALQASAPLSFRPAAPLGLLKR